MKLKPGLGPFTASGPMIGLDQFYSSQVCMRQLQLKVFSELIANTNQVYEHENHDVHQSVSTKLYIFKSAYVQYIWLLWYF